MKRLPHALAASLLLAGCALRPPAQPPAPLEMPAAFRGEHASGPSLGARDWRQVFSDPAQVALIEAALAGNLDLQVAEARMRESRAGVAAARAGGLPQVAIGLSTSPTARAAGDLFTSSFLLAGLLDWEIDLWGRIRAGTEAAVATEQAAQAARDGAQVSLVAEVAARQYELAALRELLDRVSDNARLQRDTLRLLSRRNEAGIVSSAEIRSFEAQLAATDARLPELRRQLAATENAVSLLLGQAPAAIASPALPQQALAAPLPAGLPAELLLRRPDLRQAERALAAADARVAEAHAAYFPRISLTGVFGRISDSLSDVVAGGAHSVSSLGPAMTAPLYSGGGLQANRDAALARRDQALLAYRLASLNALREVADALESYQRSGEQLRLQQERVQAQREALRLADRRFASGVVSFIEVLDAQRQLLAADTDLVNARLSRQLGLVQVYRSLGGGWTAARPPAEEGA